MSLTKQELETYARTEATKILAMPNANDAIERLEQSTRYTDRLVVAMCKLIQAQDRVARAQADLEETARTAMESSLEYVRQQRALNDARR